MAILRKLSQRMPYPLFLRLFYLKHRWTKLRREGAVAQATHIPAADVHSLGACKQSDTLVLLGSGPSINAIPESFWDAIRPYDTIGFNFWLYHPFVPRLYFVETISQSAGAEVFRRYEEIAREREHDYADIPKVVTELWNLDQPSASQFPASWQRTIRYVPTIPVPARSGKELAQGLEYLRNRGVFGPSSPLWFKQASTLSFLVGLAVKLGYRRIVICGVDLKTTDYFYQDPQRYPRSSDVCFHPAGRPHPTADPLEWRVPIHRVLLVLKELLLDPAGIQIFVQNRDSALFPIIPEMPADFFTSQSV